MVIASLAVPLAIAVIGALAARNDKSAELSARYVELAIGILRAEPTKQTKPLRGWAIQLLERNSAVPVSQEVRQVLEDRELTSLSGTSSSPIDDQDFRQRIANANNEISTVYMAIASAIAQGNQPPAHQLGRPQLQRDFELREYAKLVDRQAKARALAAFNLNPTALEGVK